MFGSGAGRCLVGFLFFEACPQSQPALLFWACRCLSLCGTMCASVSASNAAASITWWSLMGRSAAAGRGCSGTTPGGARRRGRPLPSPPNGRSAGGALQRQLLSRMGLELSALCQAGSEYAQASGTGGPSSTGGVCAAANCLYRLVCSWSSFTEDFFTMPTMRRQRLSAQGSPHNSDIAMS